MCFVTAALGDSFVVTGHPFIRKTWQVAVFQKRTRTGWLRLSCIPDLEEARKGWGPGYIL